MIHYFETEHYPWSINWNTSFMMLLEQLQLLQLNIKTISHHTLMNLPQSLTKHHNHHQSNQTFSVAWDFRHHTKIIIIIVVRSTFLVHCWNDETQNENVTSLYTHIEVGKLLGPEQVKCPSRYNIIVLISFSDPLLPDPPRWVVVISHPWCSQ